MAKKIKLKKGNDVVDFPVDLIKNILSKAGYTGKHLTLTVTGVLKEVSKLGTAGVVSAVQLEKAIVNAIHNTNNYLMNNAKKITKKVLK